jgi:hypothetical protein
MSAWASTGPVLFGKVGTAGEASVTGDAVNVASRLEHAAPAGNVLISHDTFRHVRGIFDVVPRDPLTVKGKSGPLRTYVVERAKPRAFRMSSRGVEGVETRMVGRDSELGALQKAFADTVRDSTARLVTVVGEAGAGKSRLLYEFTNWLDLLADELYLFQGRSVPAMQAVPRGLLREVFAARFEIFDDDSTETVTTKLRHGLVPLTEREADVVGHWLGFDLGRSEAVHDLAGSAEFDTIARGHLFGHLRWLVSDSPAVVLLEDVHWSDSDSLDSVDHFLQALRDVPVLVVCVTRPTLFEHYPGWGSTAPNSTSVRLLPLTHQNSRELVHEILQLSARRARGPGGGTCRRQSVPRRGARQDVRRRRPDPHR